MQDQFSGQAGSYIVDPDAGIRIPVEDWAVYQADKSAYNSDPEKAREAFAAKPGKQAKPSTTKE